MSTNQERMAGASGQESDQPAAWRIVDHRNARALVTTDADTAQHAEASEHHRVDPLYLRPAPDPLGLAARVTVLEEAIKTAYGVIQEFVLGNTAPIQQDLDDIDELWEEDDPPAAEAVREVVRTGILYLEAEEPCDVTELSAPIGVVITRWSEHRKAVDHLRTVFPSLAASLEGK